MAEDIPITEVRRVLIQYEIRVPESGGFAPPPEQPAKPVVDRDLVEAVRQELIKAGRRNPDIFGGLA